MLVCACSFVSDKVTNQVQMINWWSCTSSNWFQIYFLEFMYVFIIFLTAYIHFTFSIYHLITSNKNVHKIFESFWHREESMCKQSSVVVPLIDATRTSVCITVEEIKVKNIWWEKLIKMVQILWKLEDDLTISL